MATTTELKMENNLLEEEEGEDYLTKYDVELYLKKNPQFAKQFVYTYLKNNLDVADEFFQTWYDNMIGLSLKRVSRRDRGGGSSPKGGNHVKSNFNTNLVDESHCFVGDNELHERDNHAYNNKILPNMNHTFLENNANRRRSDPVNNDVKKLMCYGSDECLDTIEEDLITRTSRSNSMVLPQETRYRTISMDENNNSLQKAIELLQLPANSNDTQQKPYLRKAQSAPTYKKNLSNLIRSSVYSGVGVSKQINIENHTGLRESNEMHYLVEIIKDISKDMSLTKVCFKILVNLGFLLNTEKASIFLVHMDNENGFLKLLLNDVSIAKGVRKESLSSSVSKKPQHIPIGSGIVGHVAKTGQSLVVNDISKFKEYHPIFDNWWTTSTKNALLQPVKNSEDKTIAVTVSTNNKSGDFVDEDKQIGASFLSYCGISITNALIFELTKEEFERNKMLLEFSHDIFEEQSSLTNAIQKILNKALEMFNCKRASLMLLDDPKEVEERQVFSKLFQVTSEIDKKEKRFSKFQRDSMVFSSNFDPFSDVVADTKTLISKNQKKMILSSTPVSSVPAGILCEDGLISIPVRNNSSQIVGVLKLYDREDSSTSSNGLSANEEQLLEAFAIFAGLGINNCIMYDNIVKGQAHQKVALEALSYHTGARQTDVDKLKLASIPACSKFHLTSFTFDDFSLLDHEMLAAGIRMFMEFGFLKKFQIDYEVLCRFLITVKNNYRRVIYHNWRHAFNVTQSMFAMLTTGKMSEQLSSSECLALLVGCLCHDLDHRGTNNEFQMKTDSPLQKLYGTSTMEQHHFNCAVTILNSEGNNIFAHLQSQEYRKVMKLLKHAILATDLSNYIRQRDKFSNAVAMKSLDTSLSENRAMLRSMLMTASDLSGITKPWDIQKRVVHLVTSEFFHQGDIERDQLHVQPMQMMDRNYILQLPKMQVNFFQFMGIPVYKVLSDYNPLLNPFLEGARSNKETWFEMNAEIEKGHVHPDIEPVLHPVRQEEIP